MFLLAGLMGMMAVGAMAYIALSIPETSPKHHDDTCKAAADKGPGDVYSAIPQDSTDEVTPTSYDPGVDAAEHSGANCADMVINGDGADTIAIGNWLNDDHQAEVADFSTDEDSLLVVYDDQSRSDPGARSEGRPQVGIERDGTDSARRYVTLDGVRIAAVDNAEGLTLGHIALMGQSALTVRRAA